MEFEVLAEGLRFPEGPIAMEDGSVILVEIERGTLTRVWSGRAEVIAHVGGGPNGAALGPDGAVWITNNGGFEWHDIQGMLIPGHQAPDYAGGRIERVDLSTGKVERVYGSVNGFGLRGPNDLVFDGKGGFWFTDLGKSQARTRDQSGLYHARADGSRIVEAAYGYVGLNGVGLSPDGATVYAAETHTAKLWAFDITAEGAVAQPPFGQAGRVIATMPGHVYFDSLAVEADGRVCVATLLDGGVTAIQTDGTWERVSFPDLLTTNICFGGPDMRNAFITLSTTGKLIKTRWPRAGLGLAHVG